MYLLSTYCTQRAGGRASLFSRGSGEGPSRALPHGAGGSSSDPLELGLRWVRPGGRRPPLFYSGFALIMPLGPGPAEDDGASEPAGMLRKSPPGLVGPRPSTWLRAALRWRLQTHVHWGLTRGLCPVLPGVTAAGAEGGRVEEDRRAGRAADCRWHGLVAILTCLGRSSQGH